GIKRKKGNNGIKRSRSQEGRRLEGARKKKKQNIDEAAEKLRAKGIEVLALVCHVSNDQQKKDLIQKIAQCASVLLLKTQKKARAGSDLSLTRMRLLKMRKFKELKMMLPWSSKLVRVS
ncbi:hypothetical protein S245_035076, partial [Arachis hypogaea]